MITRKDIETRIKKYSSGVKYLGIYKQCTGDISPRDYIKTILEKKDLLSTQTKKDLYRILGEDYANTDNLGQARRYLILADGLEIATKSLEICRDRWKRVYRDAFQDYKGY